MTAEYYRTLMALIAEWRYEDDERALRPQRAISTPPVHDVNWSSAAKNTPDRRTRPQR